MSHQAQLIHAGYPAAIHPSERPLRATLSKILGLTAKQLPNDWQQRYGYRPLLLETVVEKNRFTGACYRAANWIQVGETKGRGKLGPPGKLSVPIKDVWLYYPLGKYFKRDLVR